MKTRRISTRTMVQFALLTAIILIMAFTPLGYLKLGVVEITFITVPVAIGAIVMGPTAGALLGAVFGITSFITCFGMSAFGAALLAINPITTCIMCIVPRALCGWLCGIVAKAFRSRSTIACLVSALVCPLMNTVLFVLGLMVFFYQTDYIQGFVTAMGATNPLVFGALFVGVQGLVEAGVCTALAGLVSKAVCAYTDRHK